MKRKIKSLYIYPLVIILVSVLSVFLISRLVAYLILIRQALPGYLFVSINNFRLHHFVYGNILIVITSFLAIGLGIGKHRKLFALFYGIGLGLVLDEFLLWMGNVGQLTNSVMWIPYSATAVAVVSLVIASLILIRLYRD